MAQQQLHGVERLPLRYTTARERASPRMCAEPSPKTRAPVQDSDVCLQAVGCQVFDKLAFDVDATLNTQFKRAALLRYDQARARHQAAILAAIQRHTKAAAISPFDVTIIITGKIAN
ncbi:hypothetical protein BCO71033_06737 [Burkholderia contaminans]|uniref:Uncharacterized protein n=1 Tax=Burkholderia contaminans TaxID=488447 RepID=A0A6P3BU24_9BURK|nr:hypothetical protein [Burkholderia contaminans]VWD62314.1 hypothetical protein BCO71033_06737 [Burkholderia contaminans]